MANESYVTPDLQTTLKEVQKALDELYTGSDGEKLLYPKGTSASDIGVQPFPTIESELGFSGSLGRSTQANLALGIAGGAAWDMTKAAIAESLFSDRRARNKHLAEAMSKERLGRAFPAPVQDIDDINDVSDFFDFAGYAIGNAIGFLPDIAGGAAAGFGVGSVGAIAARKSIEKAMQRELKDRLKAMGVHTKDLNKVITGKALPANKEAAKIVQRKIAAANIVGAKAKDTYTKTLQSIGKISGTYAGITGLESGINLLDIYESTGELKPGIAFKYGALAGAAETPVALFWLAKWAKMGGRFKKGLTDKAKLASIDKKTRGVLAEIGVTGLKGAAFEVPQEMFQEAMNVAAVREGRGATGPITGAERHQIVNAGAAALIAGGAMGSFTGATGQGVQYLGKGVASAKDAYDQARSRWDAARGGSAPVTPEGGPPSIIPPTERGLPDSTPVVPTDTGTWESGGVPTVGGWESGGVPTIGGGESGGPTVAPTSAEIRAGRAIRDRKAQTLREREEKALRAREEEALRSDSGSPTVASVKNVVGNAINSGVIDPIRVTQQGDVTSYGPDPLTTEERVPQGEADVEGARAATRAPIEEPMGDLSAEEQAEMALDERNEAAYNKREGLRNDFETRKVIGRMNVRLPRKVLNQLSAEDLLDVAISLRGLSNDEIDSVLSQMASDMDTTLKPSPEQTAAEDAEAVEGAVNIPDPAVENTLAGEIENVLRDGSTNSVEPTHDDINVQGEVNAANVVVEEPNYVEEVPPEFNRKGYESEASFGRELRKIYDPNNAAYNSARSRRIRMLYPDPDVFSLRERPDGRFDVYAVIDSNTAFDDAYVGLTPLGGRRYLLRALHKILEVGERYFKQPTAWQEKLVENLRAKGLTEGEVRQTIRDMRSGVLRAKVRDGEGKATGEEIYIFLPLVTNLGRSILQAQLNARVGGSATDFNLDSKEAYEAALNEGLAALIDQLAKEDQYIDLETDWKPTGNTNIAYGRDGGYLSALDVKAMGENSSGRTLEEKINDDEVAIVRLHTAAVLQATSEAKVAELDRQYEARMKSIRRQREKLEKQRDLEISTDRFFSDLTEDEYETLERQRREDEGARNPGKPIFSYPADAFMSIWFDPKYTNNNKFETAAEAQEAINEVLDPENLSERARRVRAAYPEDLWDLSVGATPVEGKTKKVKDSNSGRVREAPVYIYQVVATRKGGLDAVRPPSDPFADELQRELLRLNKKNDTLIIHLPEKVIKQEDGSYILVDSETGEILRLSEMQAQQVEEAGKAQIKQVLEDTGEAALFGAARAEAVEQGIETEDTVSRTEHAAAAQRATEGKQSIAPLSSEERTRVMDPSREAQAGRVDPNTGFDTSDPQGSRRMPGRRQVYVPENNVNTASTQTASTRRIKASDIENIHLGDDLFGRRINNKEGNPLDPAESPTLTADQVVGVMRPTLTGEGQFVEPIRGDKGKHVGLMAGSNEFMNAPWAKAAITLIRWVHRTFRMNVPIVMVDQNAVRVLIKEGVIYDPQGFIEENLKNGFAFTLNNIGDKGNVVDRPVYIVVNTEFKWIGSDGNSQTVLNTADYGDVLTILGHELGHVIYNQLIHEKSIPKAMLDKLMAQYEASPMSNDPAYTFKEWIADQGAAYAKAIAEGKTEGVPALWKKLFRALKKLWARIGTLTNELMGRMGGLNQTYESFIQDVTNLKVIERRAVEKFKRDYANNSVTGTVLTKAQYERLSEQGKAEYRRAYQQIKSDAKTFYLNELNKLELNHPEMYTSDISAITQLNADQAMVINNKEMIGAILADPRVPQEIKDLLSTPVQQNLRNKGVDFENQQLELDLEDNKVKAAYEQQAAFIDEESDTPGPQTTGATNSSLPPQPDSGGEGGGPISPVGPGDVPPWGDPRWWNASWTFWNSAAGQKLFDLGWSLDKLWVSVFRRIEKLPGGEAIAKKLWERPGDKGTGRFTYTLKRNRYYGQWVAKYRDILKKLEPRVDAIVAEEGISKADAWSRVKMQLLKEVSLLREIPTDAQFEGTREAIELRKLLDQYGRWYVQKQRVTRGRKARDSSIIGDDVSVMKLIEQGYFPHMYDSQFLLTPEGKSAFMKLLDQYERPAWSGPPISDTQWEAWKEQIWRNVTGKGDPINDVIHDIFGSGDNFKWENAQSRVLKNIPTIALAEAGVIDTDLDHVMSRYFWNASKVLAWEEMFGDYRIGKEGVPYWHSSSDIQDWYDSLKGRDGGHADYKEAVQLIDIITGRKGQDISPKWKSAIDTGINYANTLYLVLAVFAQLPELMGPVLRNDGSMKGLYKHLRAAATSVAQQDHGWDMARSYGVVLEDVIQHALLDQGEDAMWTQFNKTHRMSQKAVEKMFRWNLMNSWTNFNRIFALNIGTDYIYEHADRASRGEEYSVSKLEELGLTYGEVLQYKAIRAKANSETEDNINVVEKVELAFAKFVDESVMRPGAAIRPGWMSDYRFRLFAHIKGYMWYMMEVFGPRLHRQLARNIPENQEDFQEYVRRASLLSFATFMFLPLALLGLSMRDMLFYMFAEGEPPERDFMDIFNRTGLAGPLTIPIEFLDRQKKFGFAGGAAATAGPVPSYVHGLLTQQPITTASKSLPFISSFKATREQIQGLGSRDTSRTEGIAGRY